MVEKTRLVMDLDRLERLELVTILEEQIDTCDGLLDLNHANPGTALRKRLVKRLLGMVHEAR